MASSIHSIRAMEILGSRGLPKLRVFVELEDGTVAAGSVPSGASTGEHEAVELRDTTSGRFGGRGVLEAVASVNDLIAPHIKAGSLCRSERIAKCNRLLEIEAEPGNAALFGVRIT